MARLSMKPFAFLVLLGFASLLQAQNETAKPAVIGTTFPVTLPYLGTETVSLQEDDGKLMVHTKGENGLESAHSVRYEAVNLVKVEAWPPFNKEAKPVILIEDSDGNHFEATLRTEVEAKTLATYVVHKSSAKLELIGNAWRIRKPFTCPEGSQPGCQDFKELLDHDDAEIAKYYYFNPPQKVDTYACFSTAKSQFFIVEIDGKENMVIGGQLLRHVFENGQPKGSFGEAIDWVGKGAAGSIFEGAGNIIAVDNKGRRLGRIGWLDSSSLHLQQRYTNQTKSTTEYTLNIRWSTGRYTESYSAKDYAGRPLNRDSSGICVKFE